jgi:hypothetical protein
MEEYLIFLYLIITLILLITVIRYIFFNYITNINKIGTTKLDENIYHNYFEESNNKKNRTLINNVAFLRSWFFSSIYDSDIKILEVAKLHDGDKILIFNNNDCNFEINLLQKLSEMEKQIKVIIVKNNIFDADKCRSLIDKLGFNNIDVLYINDISKDLQGMKFHRIILRENLGILDKEDLFKNLKNLLIDDKSFIYIKTLTFSPIKNSNNKKYLLQKQKNIIDFWNYNFSTDQNIINDFKKHDYEVKYKSINILFLSVFYNPIDIINLFKLYFIELDLGFNNIMDWLGIYSLNLSHFKVYHNHLETNNSPSL